MKYECGGEHMSAKEGEQQINLQNYKIQNYLVNIVNW